MSNCGIYRILNKTNNKIYIGSSKELDCRKYNHFYNLRKGLHHSRHLQNAWDKSKDKSCFVFEILEFCEEDKLLEREDYYLNLYCKSEDYKKGLNSDFLKVSYNMKPTSMKGFSGKHSDSTILKLKMVSKLRKDIMCYTADGKLYKEFLSSKDAEVDTGVFKTNILKVCKNKTYISKSGYIFGFKEDSDFIKFINESDKPIVYQVHNKNKKMEKSEIRKLPWCTAIKVTNLNTGEVLDFHSQKEACVYYGLQPCTVNLCLKRSRPYRKYLLFQYHDIVRSL